MMREESLKRVRAIPGHENAEISDADYARVEYVYMFHPAILDVGGKEIIANLYAYGGMLVIRDMYARAKKADDAERKVAEIRHEIAGAEKRIAEIMAEVMK